MRKRQYPDVLVFIVRMRCEQGINANGFKDGKNSFIMYVLAYGKTPGDSLAGDLS
jgi:hypothetical protein